MITITKLEAEHIQYALHEVLKWVQEYAPTEDAIEDQLDSSYEIITGCLVNNEVDKTIN